MKVARPVRRAGRRNPPAERPARALRLDPYITGTLNQSAIGTLVERSTRFTILVHFVGTHDAEQLRDSMTVIFNRLPLFLRRSLTWDQGIEMARHHEFSAATTMPVYFCEPRSPWQRGTNENTNGLLRQYFPKSTDLSVYTPDDLQRVADELNERPRKSLGWRSPSVVFASLKFTAV
jgi:transposase, IS30 family